MRNGLGTVDKAWYCDEPVPTKLSGSQLVVEAKHE